VPWNWLIFLLVLVGTGLMLAATLALLMALTLLRPNRMTDGKATVVLQRLSPGDLDLKFEDLHFTIRDEQTARPMTLAAWWIPAVPTSTRTILLIHGYADAKVGAIAWAPTLHSLGWNILAIDLRAHGHSPGVFSTAGYRERHDVNQVINQFRAMRPAQTETFVLFGVSLGAAVALAALALREADAKRDDRPGDIDAVVLESPFADYRRAVAAHGKMRGLPGGVIRDAAVRLAEWIARADFRAVRPRDLVRQAGCPVMLLRAGDDPFIPGDDAAAMADAFAARHNPRDVRWDIPDAGHVLGLAVAGPDEYRRRIGAFLDAAVRRDHPVAQQREREASG
jgi:pimeloyl-ACP methyl ester carboxylesterase